MHTDKKNIAVLVSGGGTNLQALIDAEKSGIIKSGKIRLVISNKDGAFALERAKKAEIDTYTVLKKDFSSHAEFESEIIRISMDVREGKPLQLYNGNEVKIIDKNKFETGMCLWAD